MKNKCIRITVKLDRKIYSRKDILRQDYKINCEIAVSCSFDLLSHFHYILYIFSLHLRSIASALCHDIRYNIANLPIIRKGRRRFNFVARRVIAAKLCRDG